MLPAHVCKKIVGRTLLSAAFDFPCGAGLVLSVVEGPVLSVVEGVRQPQLKEGKGWASPPETIVRAIPRGALDRDTLDRCANCRNLDQLSGRAVWPSAPGRLSLATRTLDPYFPARRTNRQRPSEICSCAWRLLCWRPVPSARTCAWPPGTRTSRISVPVRRRGRSRPKRLYRSAVPRWLLSPCRSVGRHLRGRTAPPGN